MKMKRNKEKNKTIRKDPTKYSKYKKQNRKEYRVPFCNPSPRDNAQEPSNPQKDKKRDAPEIIYTLMKE
jgi:hypothetical protein